MTKQRLTIPTKDLWPHDVVIEFPGGYPALKPTVIGYVEGDERLEVIMENGCGNGYWATHEWVVERDDEPVECDCNACFAMEVRGNDGSPERDRHQEQGG